MTSRTSSTSANEFTQIGVMRCAAGQNRRVVQRVLCDANVLFSLALRDWAYHLQVVSPGMFSMVTTLDIIAEVQLHMRRTLPLADGGLLVRIGKQIAAICNEEFTKYNPEVASESFTGSDKNDLHVHSAAVAGKIDLLVTNDRSSGITAHPDSEPYEILTADEFFMLAADSSPRALAIATKKQLEYWGTRGDRPEAQLDDYLRKAECPMFAERVHSELLRVTLSG